MECSLCELHEQCKRPVAGGPFSSLESAATTPKEVMIIGDFPHEEEIQSMRSLSGRVGTELAKLLQTVGIPISTVYVTNLVKCRPLAPNGLDGRMKKVHVEACQIYLIEEIANINPKLIILLGDSVFRYFYPNDLFSDNRGKIQTNNQFGIPTLTTYHPMTMLSTAKFDPIITTDFWTAAAFLNGESSKANTKKDYRLIVKSLDLLEKVAKRVKEVPTFAFDIETHGKGLFSYKLLSVGLSWKKDTGVSVPVYVRDEEKVKQIEAAIAYEPPERYTEEVVTLKNGKQKIKKTKVKGWLEEDTKAVIALMPEEYREGVVGLAKRDIKLKLEAILDKEPPLKRYWGDQHERCMALIKEIMECDTPKGAHNGSYDVNRLRGKGIIVKNYAWDTILMHHMIDEERPHGLDDLSFVYTKDGGYKSEKNKYLKSSKTSWANIPMDVLLPYNAQDADVTLQLYHIFREKIYKEPKRVKLFEKHIMPAQHMLCDMEFRGSNIDVEWVKKTRAEYLAKMNDYKIEFSQLVSKVMPNVYVVDSPEEQAEMEKQIKEQAAEAGVEPKLPNFLNMNSVQQLIVLFRDYYKIPLTKKTKSGDALDDKVLQKIAKKNKAAEVLRKYKKLKKLESTYLSATLDNIDTDGKLHTEFLLYGTATSRLSSRRPNIQNINGDMKTMFIPPSKDYFCVNVDQSAAELHTLAWMSQDKTMTDIFEHHRDLHKETAAAVFNKKIEDVTDSERKIAKRCFSSDAFILTEDGYIRGKDIGDRKVYTLDGKLQNQRHVYEEREGYKITLRNGVSLKVTKDHKFLDFTRLKPVYKEAREFKVGDVLGFRKNVPMPTEYVMLHNDVTLKTHTKRYPEYMPLDEDFAYLIGCVLSDGSIMNQYKHGPASHIGLIAKYEAREKFNGEFGKKFGIYSNTETDKYTQYGISSVELAQLLDKMCGRRKAKHIPDELFRSPKSVVDSFLSAMIDGDGCTTKGVIHFDNTNENLINDLCRLATLYGYAVTKRQEEYHARIRMNKDPNKVYHGICYTCTFISKPSLTLSIKHKAEGLAKKTDYVGSVNTWPIDKVELKALKGKSHDISYNNYRDGRQKGLTDAFVNRWDLLHKDYWSSEIKSIEPVKFEALVMETDTHFFVGEGLDSHNCSFGVSYGISGKGLADILEPEGVKITESQGNKFIEKWRNTYKDCARYLDSCIKNFKRYGYLETPFGRRRHKYKRYADAGRESSSDRQAANFPIQSTASDIQVYEMVQMYPTLIANGVLPVFTVHDSIVMWCPKDKLLWLRDYYKKMTCRRFPNEEFPGLNNCLMYTEMEVGRNYGEHIKLPYDADFEQWKEENKFLYE